jgi:ethylbenzene dehydrogenase
MKDAARFLLLLALLAGVACKKEPVRTAEVVAAHAAQVPLDPGDPAWDRAPEHLAKLLPQDLVDPRLMKPSTPEVRVRAVSNGRDLAFRLEWLDAQQNDRPGPGSMVDSCAVQIPRTADPKAPDPQMGEAGKPVEITFWRADWQAAVNGRGDTIQDLYPNASIDHYPFQAKPLEPGSDVQKEFANRYAPARALGNRRAGPREVPVEDMVAEGPGTLSPAASTTSKGKGQRTATGWAVVLSRRAPAGLAPRQRTQVAFAVWEGSQKEAGARKMRTGWIPLLLQGEK